MLFRILLPLVAALGCTALPAAKIAAAATIEGKVDEIDAEEYELTIIDAQGRELDFDVDDDCVVLIDGEDSDFEELEVDSQVKLTTKKKKGQEIVVKIVARSPK